MEFDTALRTTEFDAFYTFNPARLMRATRDFVEGFPGSVLYAVKANPLPQVISSVRAAGVAGFDVASIAEALLVQAEAPGARSWFMNPAKSRRDIERAWRELGLRDFVVDCAAELDKLLEVLPTGEPSLRVHVRFHSGASDALYDLNSKFGASHEETLRLLQRIAAQTAWSSGLAFHPGSQTISIEPYLTAMQTAARLIERADARVASLDIGGGFPARYDNMPMPPPAALLQRLGEFVASCATLKRVELLCEPGRVLAYDCMSLFARVILRKDRALYCGAGIFGGLLPAQQFFQLPVRAWRGGEPIDDATAGGQREFVVFGPTCDSNDRLAFPYALPEHLREGDWIEFQHVGAYSESVRCAFNGFSVDHLVTLDAHEAG
ncbi:type III PLP-dependent enzyme [Variovorax gossypii]|uniref:ornithine decarboxylase n=1 Tax=Variovorax gossypii TaxID=1679495 RepID=A0A431THT4_9BURK|nr:alanine racemase [Variovorax gossypii]RTQ32914.1 type III PLP-dependent enzyme [Variovorax gossypii]